MQRRFNHHQLEVYGLSLELTRMAHAVVKELPRGSGRLADQLRRASIAVPLLIAEGASRTTCGQKRQRYTEARGETGEVAAAVEVAMMLGLADATVEPAHELAGRVAAMLTRLIRRQG